MNYDELKRNIADVVKPNGNQEITGQIMQDALFALIENLGEGWQFGGAVRPSDVPALGADVRAFYLAVEKGVYADFGGVEVTELSAIVYGDGWGVLPLGVAFGVDTETEIGALSERVKALEADGSVTTSRIADKAVTTDKIADKAVVRGKLSEDLQKVLDNAGTKAIRINYDDVEAAKKAIADYNADPNKTVVLVNYAGIRIPAIVSDTYNPVIVAYVPEGINVHKLLFQGDAWSETVIYGDNVRYNNQTLTAAQKAQARKNIDVDYLTEDEVANLWDTTK